jgi:fibronectin-binding autotransporter adhesin
MEFKQNTTTNNILPIDTDLTVGTNDNIAVFNLGLANAQVASLSGNGIVAATSTNTSPALRTLTINGSTPANDSTFSGIIQNYYNDLNTAPNTNGVVVLTKNGTSSLTLTGLNSQTGTTTLNDGTITVSSSGALSGAAAPLTVNGGTLNLNNPAQTVSTLTGAASGNLVLGVGHTLMTDPAAGSTFAGTISGPGGLTKLNVLSGATARTLILSGNNTYDGPTTISGGTIQVGSATALGSTAGDTSIAAGASVLFDGPTSNFTISEAFSIAGTGSGSLGSAIFVQNGANITISSPVTLTAAATVGVSGAGTVAYTNSAAFTAADQTLTLQGGALSTGNGGSISGVIALGSGGLTKLQGGKWVLSAANTYTGITTISAGTLVAASDSALGTAAGGTTVASGAVLGFQGDINYTTAEPVSIGGTGAISNISGTNTFAGPITLTANSSISAASGSLTLTNAIGETAGPLNLTKSGTGTLVLRAMNTYTGTTTVSAGTLSAASDAALGTTDGGTTVASAATLGFQGDINYATAEPVGIGGNGVGGAGALNNLSGTNTFAGPITMTADSSIGATDGSLTLTKTIGGAYKLTKVGTGTLIISGPQSYSSLLVAAGTATLDSSLSNATITNAGGMLNLNANANNSTINANSSAGTNIHVSQTLSALNIGASGIVTLSAPPPPASDDGALALSGGVAQAVPEPGTLSLVLFGALSLLRRQRRNSGFQIPDSK